nr:Zinc finger domain containing protein [Haemonchus contortus]
MDTSQIDKIELLLDDVVAPDPIASMKAFMDTLVGTVKEIAHKSALQAPQPGAPSTSAASNPATIEQLNRADFDNTEYHTTFDPIAAAQARKEERALAEAEGISLDTDDNTIQAPRDRAQSKQGQDVPSKLLPIQSRDVRASVPLKRELRCNNCNEYGHFLRDCKKLRGNKPETKSKTTSKQLSEGPRVVTASLYGRPDIADGMPSRYEGPVGERMTANVKVLGLSCTALLDTGSQISIVPLKVLRAGQLSGFNVNQDIEKFPLENQSPIYDASGNKMQFEGAVKLPLELEETASGEVKNSVLHCS